MKKIVVTFLFAFAIQSIMAHGPNGARFEYQVIDSNIKLYKVRCIIMWNCNSTPLSNQIQIDINYPNGCPGKTETLTAIVQQPSNILAPDVTPFCSPKLTNSCMSSSASLYGIKRYVFEKNIQFSSNCGYALLTYSSCCRNINSGPGSISTLSNSSSTNLFVETMINLDLNRGNNSLTYNNYIYPLTGGGNKIYYNFGGDEIDQDSVEYSLFSPYTAANNASVIYASGYSAYKPLTMQEPNIIIDQNSGQMEFTPTNLSESSLFGVKATEYRKLKSSQGSDSFVIAGYNTIETVISFYFNAPKISIQGVQNNTIKNGFYINNKKIQLCNVGDTVQFKLMATAENLATNNSIEINWDLANASEQFLYKNITYVVKKDTAGAKDTLIATVKFIPASTLSGCRPLYLNVTNCLNGYFTNQKYVVSICNIPMSFAPTLTMTTDTNTICQGIPIKFKATQNINAYHPTLSWFKNGIIQGTGDSFNIQNIKNQDSIWCGVNSTNYCNTAIPKWHYTNKTKITVTDNIRATLQLTKDRDTLCLGDTINIQALAPSGSINPVYTWYINNLPISNTGSKLSSSSLSQNDRIFAKIKLNQICVKKDSAYSDTIKIIKVNKVDVITTIADNNNPSCAGDLASLTLNASNTGSNPKFYWYKNNVLVDSNKTSFQFMPINNDQVYARMKSSLACVVQNNIISNTLNYAITATSTPTIQLNAPNPNPCKNAPVMVSATYNNEGSNPKFYWYQNNYLVDSNKTQFQFLANIYNKITCKLVSNKPCISKNNIYSDTLFSFPSPPILSKVNIVCLTASIYQNDTAVFFAKTVDMGANPIFTWYINSQPIPNYNNDTIYIPRLKNNDTVHCKLSSILNCALENPVTSNKIVMKVTSSIEEIEHSRIYTVYPNPTTHSIHLKHNHPLKTALHAILRNTTGMLVAEKYWYPNQMNHTLDIQHLNAGMYMLELNDAESTQTFKIIKE